MRMSQARGHRRRDRGPGRGRRRRRRALLARALVRRLRARHRPRPARASAPTTTPSSTCSTRTPAPARWPATRQASRRRRASAFDAGAATHPTESRAARRARRSSRASSRQRRRAARAAPRRPLPRGARRRRTTAGTTPAASSRSATSRSSDRAPHPPVAQRRDRPGPAQRPRPARRERAGADVDVSDRRPTAGASRAAKRRRGRESSPRARSIVLLVGARSWSSWCSRSRCVVDGSPRLRRGQIDDERAQSLPDGVTTHGRRRRSAAARRCRSYLRGSFDDVLHRRSSDLAVGGVSRRARDRAQRRPVDRTRTVDGRARAR